ncbi:Lactoylglutathione lyase GLX1 [Citrus sinensis]|uniref:Lactoylglutathione lyase GLX1 n=1 Tax=Citrus sinensis TaxID=2711 RepID=A0ACB8NID3_CITSI|nr:Lactoylglutathione lyase GLX1 [Citrus sinensis]
MAEASPAVANAELLEWPKKDKRRFLHAVYRVGDLDRTIKYYTECFGMELLRKRDVPEEKYSNAFLGFGPEQSYFVVELTYNYGVTSYDIGTGFGHLAIATEDALGMKLLRTIDSPELKCALAMLGYAEEDQTTVLELAYSYGVTEYTKGNAYAQVAISTDDVYKSAEVVNLVTQELGGKITRQPGPIPGLNTKITSFVDPDGWKTVLVDNEDFLKELQSE